VQCSAAIRPDIDPPTGIYIHTRCVAWELGRARVWGIGSMGVWRYGMGMGMGYGYGVWGMGYG